MRFDYFYGKESDMMSFYRVPKLLITDPYFEDLDNEAKLMYGLMLDRMSLSAKNGWYDNQRRVYIIYGQKSLMKDLHRGRNKISDMLNALEKIGLIEREKDRKYNPDKIYVKMFVDQASQRRARNNAVPEIQTSERKNNVIRITGPADDKKVVQGDTMLENQTLQSEYHAMVIEKQPSRDDAMFAKQASTDVPMFENQTSEDDIMFEDQTYETESCLENKHDMFANQTYACTENKHAHVWNPNTNYTEINKTDYSYTESNHILSADEKSDGIGCDEDERAYRDVIEENINAEALCHNYPDDAGIINGIVDLIVDKLTSAKDEIIVCGEPRSANSVKGRLMKLNRFHIEYVLDCWNRLAEPPRKPDQYLLAMLYNASTTSDAQLKAELNRDYPQYNTALNGRAQ